MSVIAKLLDVVSELKSWGVNVVVVDPWADPIEIERAYGITLGKVAVVTSGGFVDCCCGS